MGSPAAGCARTCSCQIRCQLPYWLSPSAAFTSKHGPPSRARFLLMVEAID